MMIELAMAIVLQSASGEVSCDLAIKTGGLSRRQRVIEVTTGCPDDFDGADALQIAAGHAARLLNYSRVRSAALMTADRAYFSANEDGNWRAVPGQIVITEPVAMPPELIAEGYSTLSCSWAAYPDVQGRPRSPRITCYVDGRTRPAHIIRLAENAIDEMLRRTRFLPVNVDYCFQDEVRVTANVIDVTGGRFNNDNEIEPDMRPLPQHCG
jgi:hypothetical protein